MPERIIIIARSELERMLLELLRGSPDCKEARLVTVRRMEETWVDGPNWTVDTIEYGRAPYQACEAAMKQILPLMQEKFELVLDDA